jgi:hypothetical protein
MIMGKRNGKGDGSDHGNHHPWPGMSRRRRLLQLGALGTLGPAGLCGLIQAALANGDAPPLAGINSLSGSATINGVAAKVGTPVKPGDEIATARGGSAVVVIGRDAFLLRENTRVIFEPKRDEPGVLGTIVVSAGKLLSVFGKRSNSTLTLRAQAATIGIRGTGCYLEIEPGRTIKTVHHDNPVWLDERGTSMTVEKGPFLNHRDEELILLEKLTGREPPFVKLGLSGRY